MITTVEQVRAFSEATAEDRLAALWLLLFRTGLRRGMRWGCPGRTWTLTPHQTATRKPAWSGR
jgi:hypothetical protein